MTPIERKSSIRKAPQTDVVEALTKQSANDAQLTEGDPLLVEGQNQTSGSSLTLMASRPGPGRPRSKRRMEPFSSKIEISLRDDLDRYLAEREMTVVAFLDEVIRERLNRE